MLLVLSAVKHWNFFLRKIVPHNLCCLCVFLLLCINIAGSERMTKWWKKYAHGKYVRYGNFFVNELHSCIIFTSDHGPSLWWLTKLFKKSLKTCKKKKSFVSHAKQRKKYLFWNTRKKIFLARYVAVMLLYVLFLSLSLPFISCCM